MTSAIRYELPARPDLSGPDGLLPFLLANRDQSLQISLAGLRRLDTPLLQLLVASAVDWQRRGLGWALEGVSQDHAQQIEILGFSPNSLQPVVPAPDQSRPAPSEALA